MAGQGQITRSYASQLRDDGWHIIYVCIPNTPHIGVVPIPIVEGLSKQRYPDIVAVKGNIILLVEVEMSLSDFVCEDIILRFAEMRNSLSIKSLYSSWSAKITSIANVEMPEKPTIETHLLIVNKKRDEYDACIKMLNSYSIAAYFN